MRDVNNGWLIRYLHANTASAFFFVVSIYVFIYGFSLCISFIIFTVNPPVYSTPPGINSTLPVKLEYTGKGEGSPGDLSSIGNDTGHIPNQNKPLVCKQCKHSLSDEDFAEWFRGFVDAEGCFLIQVVQNRFKLVFVLCLHRDELPLLEYLAQRLGVGGISIREKTVSYTVSSKEDLARIFIILDKRPLNTSKNLNYAVLRQAYDLYFNRESVKVSMELHKKMTDLKNQMNKNRTDFNQPKDHSIHITRY